MDFLPAVSFELAQATKDVGSADVMVAISAYNNESTISNVMKKVAEGLSSFFGDMKSVLLVCEGGSLDETKNVARRTDIGLTVNKIVGTYRGESGKGNALRAVFQSALDLGVKGCAVIDADIRSITPEWVNNLLDPVMHDEYGFVTPAYERYKYDGTITNTIVYPLITALYGKKIRQPIGGDFGLSRKFIEYLAKQEVWDNFVGQFGIDAWLTISAITSGAKICQAKLGAKVHNAKDPAFTLGLMYLHVLSTIFRSMGKFEDFWQGVRGAEDVEVKGTALPWEPEPIPISVTKLVEEFTMGMAHFSPLYRELLSKDTYSRLEHIANSASCSPDEYCDFRIPADLWARSLYDLSIVFNCWEGDTHKLIDLSSPLYYGEVATFANRTQDQSSEEVEEVVEDIQDAFENQKVYLMDRWKECKAGKSRLV